MTNSPEPGGTTSYLDAAVARPRATAFGLDAYPDDYTKAAALIGDVVDSG